MNISTACFMNTKKLMFYFKSTTVKAVCFSKEIVHGRSQNALSKSTHLQFPSVPQLLCPYTLS